MATQVVEISGDAAKLLRVYDEAIRKEKEHLAALERTGKAGQDAGDDIGEGMARATKHAQRDFERLTRELRGFGDEGRAAAAALKTHLQDAGKAGHRSMSAVLDALGELDPAARAAAEAAGRSLEASGDDAFREAIEQLRRLGPAGAQAADRIQKDIDAAAAGSVGSIAEIAARLEALGPEGATTAERIRQDFTEASRQIEFDATLAELRRLGPEGSTVADRIRRELQQADAEAAGGMTAILDRLQQIDPAAADAAAAIKSEMEEAARYSDGQFEETLRTLRSMGPVGKQVADELRKDLVAAGQLSERSIDDVIAKLHKIDPAAAAAARAIRTKIEDAANKGEGAFARFGDSAKAQLAGIAGGFTAAGGVHAAIRLGTTYLKEQEEILKRSLEMQLSLANAQQEAVKNLAGKSRIEKSEILQATVFSIASDVGFPDLNALTTAAGDTNSAGASDEQLASALFASSQLTRLTPDQLPKVSGAAIDLANATGLVDAEANLGLLLSAGTQARITDPLKLATTLAPTLASGVPTIAKGEDRVEASREIAALFGTLAKPASDTTGDPTRTATIKLTNELNAFFSDLEGQRIEARSALQKIDEKRNPTEQDTADRERLTKFVAAAEGVEDSGTVFGRIQQLQQSPEIREQFFSREFGEEVYKEPFKQIATAGSALAETLLAAKEQITADREFFRAEVSQLTGANAVTPQLTLAGIEAQFAADQAVFEATNTEGSSLADVRKVVGRTLESTRPSDGLINGMLQSLGERGINEEEGGWIPSGRLGGSTAAEEAISGIGELFNRRTQFTADGVTTSEQSKVALLDQRIKTLAEIVEGLSGRGLDTESAGPAAARARKQLAFMNDPNNLQNPAVAPSVDAVAPVLQRLIEVLDRVAANAERQTAAAERTATNTGRQPTPNYNAAQQTAAAAATP